jgi:transglutaminase-like putative cysteine protease
LIFALSIVGLGISMFIGSFIPFWLMFGFSSIYSVEKWLYYFTRKYKGIGKLYRLLLNLSILSLLGLLVWSGIKLFSHQLAQSSLVGSLIFLAEFILFIWIWRVVAKNSWRWPSLKLTVFSLLCLFVIFAFAGVQPLSDYKDNILNKMSSGGDSTPTATLVPVQPIPEVVKPTPTPAPTVPTPAPSPMPKPGPRSAVENVSFDTIDQYALNVPKSAEASVESLATYLTQPAKNDLEKARAIYRWITQNISYDINAFFTGNYGDMSATGVLASRRSICYGYSGLFQKLAQAVGLEVVTINGWGKGYGYHAGDQIPASTNHAWNAIKINDGWYLVDSTWGAGYINDQNAFMRDFDDEYFLMPPEQFIYSHLPEAPKWQLLQSTISDSEFAALPFVRRQFFSYGLKLDSNMQGMIRVARDTAITIRAPNDVLLVARLLQDNLKLSDQLTFVQREGEPFQINAAFPNAGNYILRISAKRKGDAGDYWAVLDYKIEVTEGSSGSIGFPETFGKFNEKGVHLYTPKTGYLQSKTVQTFKLDVPGAEDVAVIMDGLWHHLIKQGETFEGTVTVMKGQVQVCAKFPGNQLYEGMLTYTGL